MLTPADIQNKQFATTRLKEGYDQIEVDAFLDRVQEELAILITSLNRLEEDNRTLRRKEEFRANESTTVMPPVAPTPSAIIEKMLAAAETAAREHEAEAEAKGDEIVREAGAEGARIVEEATEAAERIKSEGYAEKYRKFEELERRHSLLAAAHDRLNSRAKQVRQALQEAADTYDRETPQ